MERNHHPHRCFHYLESWWAGSVNYFLVLSAVRAGPGRRVTKKQRYVCDQGLGIPTTKHRQVEARSCYLATYAAPLIDPIALLMRYDHRIFPIHRRKASIDTMKVAATLVALAGVANAFAPAQNANRGTALSASLADMPGATAPFKGFDPLGLATLGSDSTLAWFRAAELKHSRVAMLATTGYLVQAAGVHFPGMLSSDVSFESLSIMKPLDAWDAVPDLGECGSLNEAK